MSPWDHSMLLIVASWLSATFFPALQRYTERTSLFTAMTGCQHSTKCHQKSKRIKKNLCKFFHGHDIKTMVEVNLCHLSRVIFSVITHDPTNGKHFPYTKDGNTPIYVHKQSNHPLFILRNIHESINTVCWQCL